MKNRKERMLKQFPLSQMHLFQKSKKGGEGTKVEIPAIVDGDLDIVYDESSVNLTFHTSDW